MELSNRAGQFSTQGLANNIFSVATFQHSGAAAREGLLAFTRSLDDTATLGQAVQLEPIKSTVESAWN